MSALSKTRTRHEERPPGEALAAKLAARVGLSAQAETPLWPQDPARRSFARTGAEWDPLRDPWPELLPVRGDPALSAEPSAPGTGSASALREPWLSAPRPAPDANPMRAVALSHSDAPRPLGLSATPGEAVARPDDHRDPQRALAPESDPRFGQSRAKRAIVLPPESAGTHPPIPAGHGRGQAALRATLAEASPAPTELWPTSPPLAPSAERPIIFPLSPPPEPRPRREIAPSRLSYRLHRLWLTPSIRLFVRLVLPVLLFALASAALLASETRRAAFAGWLGELREAVELSPLFRIDRVEVIAPTPEVAAAVAAELGLSLPTSTLRLDLAALKARIETFDAVARAQLSLRSGPAQPAGDLALSDQVGAGEGERPALASARADVLPARRQGAVRVLTIQIDERVPVAIWRHAGGLDLIDAEGRRVAQIASRAIRPDLPLLAGDGAPAALAEARALLAAAQPIADRIVGLVRVGVRRWDLVLDPGPRLMLPEQGAILALERVLALDAAHDLFAREIVAVDLRLPQRLVLRLSPDAAAELARIRDVDNRVAQR